MNDSSVTPKQATVTIALLVLAAKGIGFIREIIIAHRFGTSAEYDAYLVAISIPIALYVLINGTLTNYFLPRYTRAIKSEQTMSVLALLSGEYLIALAGSVVAAILVALAAPQIISLIAPGIDGYFRDQAILFTRLSTAVIILSVIESIARAVLHARKRFVVPALAPIINSLILITAILVLSGKLSTLAILIGLVAGHMAQAALIYIPYRRVGLGTESSAAPSGRQLRIFTVTVFTILVIEASAQVYAVIDRYFASFMGDGIISALGYAYIVMMLPVNLLAYALSTAIYPYLSDAFAENDSARSGYLLTRGLCVALVMGIPAAIFLFLFAEPLIILLFRRGAFDSQSVILTSNLLMAFAPGLAGQFLIWILARACYAAGRFTLLALQVILLLAAKFFLSAMAMELYGYTGLAIASSICYLGGSIIMAIFVHRVITAVDLNRILSYVGKLLAAGAMSLTAGWALSVLVPLDSTTFVTVALTSAPAVIASIAVFFAIGLIMRIPEIVDLFSAMRRAH